MFLLDPLAGIPQNLRLKLWQQALPDRLLPFGLRFAGMSLSNAGESHV